MIVSQIRPNEVSDERTVDAIAAVPREEFVPKALKGVAYVDEDLEVAPGRFLMEPMTFARLVMAAGVKADDLVLVVGDSTGYTAAVLSQLGQTVVSLEDDDAEAAEAEQNVARLDITNVVVVRGDLTGGVADQAPFDVIFLCGGVETLPAALSEQLAEGGRIVGVYVEAGVGKVRLWSKRGGVIGHRDLYDAYVPVLEGFAAPESFSF